ncbi:MAG: hypothetical protein NTX03_01090 [Bacteroidetes bacterium]|nr:hypothetical protein [Bacteroidota bacterium]
MFGLNESKAVLEKLYKFDEVSQTLPTGTGWALTGHNQDVISLITAPRSYLQSLLPKGCSLMENNPINGTDKMYPVMVQFSNAKLTGDLLEKLAPAYNEFSIMIPFVMVEGATNPGPYAYIPILFLDNFLDVLGGEIMYGFNKHISKIEYTNPSGGNSVDNQYRIFSYDTPKNHTEADSRYLYIDTMHYNIGAPAQAGSLPNFQKWTAILNQPCIEYMEIFGLVTSNFTVAYNAQTMIQPKQTTMKFYFNSFDNYYLPSSNVYSSPPITTDVFGSCYMEFDWSLSFPKLVV